ncbi:MAG: hypothetical protein NVS4B1_21110 [Ktedonobacteraceae bacterium]
MSVVFTKEQLDDPYSADKLLIRVASQRNKQDRIQTQLMTKVAEDTEMHPVEY